MTINEVIEDVKQSIDEEILCICLTGSATFCTNCKDTDIWIITREGNEYSKIRGYEGYDIFVWSLQNLKNSMDFSNKENKSLYLISLLKNEILYGENPCPDFNFFEHKNEIVEMLLYACEKTYNNPLLSNAIDEAMCLKQSIWVFANYFAFINNCFDFTDEQKEILQKCHDNELPRSYIEELYQNLFAMRQ